MQFKQHFKLIYIFVMQYIAFLVIPEQLKSYFFHFFFYLPDRESVVEGKCVRPGVELGGPQTHRKKN